jgi:DNA-directed RNA polymerase specialized sigma24 family protein
MLPVRDDELARIYGAALAAGASTRVASDVTERVVLAGCGDGAVAEAVRLAVREAPAERFAALPAAEREALALVRLAGLKVDEVARLTATTPAVVKARLTGALVLIRAAAPRRPQPRRDFGTEASRARVARAS